MRARQLEASGDPWIAAGNIARAALSAGTVHSHLTMLALALACLAAPQRARADCVLSGNGVVENVTPRGTDLRFGLSEEARVTLVGTTARVHGITPIAFEGRAASRDVALTLGTARRLSGVLVASAETPVSVRRAEGDHVTARIDAGPTRIVVTLRCDEVSFGPPAAGPELPTSGETLVAREVRARDRTLRLFEDTTSGRAVVLRSRAPVGELAWPDLAVVGTQGTRIHVRAPLDQNVGIDAWIERDSVEPLPGITRSCGCGAIAQSGGCGGHGYLSESYRGSAQVAAGTELRDATGTIWGHIVVDAQVGIAISTVRVGSRAGDDETVTRTVETVWVERLPGLIHDPCDGAGVQIDRAAVTLPEGTP